MDVGFLALLFLFLVLAVLMRMPEQAVIVFVGIPGGPVLPLAELSAR